jgi:hypothetical protein
MGMGGASEALIIPLRPIHLVVATLMTWQRPIRDLIVFKSRRTQHLVGENVFVGLIIIIGIASGI